MPRLKEKKLPPEPTIFVCPHCFYEIPVDLLQVKPKTKKIAVDPKANTAEETLEMILGGGRHTPLWEAYWQLHKAFGGALKNHQPKLSARLFACAVRAGADPQKIVAKAEMMRQRCSEAHFMPQLIRWLDGLGYAEPDTLAEAKNGDGSDRLLPTTQR
jgi:hypothetical protein